MSEQPVTPPELSEEAWEKTVRETAHDFPYPVTPDIAGAVRRRLYRPRSSRPVLRALAAIFVIALVVTLAVPGVRAAVLEFIRIGAVQIFIGAPTPTATPQSTRTPFGPPHYASVLEMPGEMTFDEALTKVSYPIPLPAYPPDLGMPDRVFVQDSRTPLLTLVWLMPDDPTQVRMSLEVLNEGMFASKYDTKDNGQAVQVDGHVGYWLEDAHLLVYFFKDEEWQRDVNAHVLIWEVDNLTYRLETNETLNEALLIAASID